MIGNCFFSLYEANANYVDKFCFFSITQLLNFIHLLAILDSSYFVHFPFFSFDFSKSFPPQLGAKPEKTVLGVPLYGRSFLLQNKANNGAIIVFTMMVAVTMMRNRMVKIRWTRLGGDIWHKLRYFMLLKGHKSRKETTPNRKQGALPPVCQLYHCHQIGPDIETYWSPIHLVPISALQSGLRSITSALHLVGVV